MSMGHRANPLGRQRATVWGLLLGGLVLLLVGCSGGGDSGSLTPASQSTPPVGTTPPVATNPPGGGSPPLEQQAVRNLVDLYREAIVQEDIDRLQALLEGDGGAFAGGSFLDVTAATFRQVVVTDLELSPVDIQGAPTPMMVTFQEALSVIDPAGLAQRTQMGRTRWQLGRRVGASGVMTILIAGVAREGPQFEVVMRGQVMAGLPTRVEVRETTGALTLAGGEVEVPETGAMQALTAVGGRWHTVITPPWRAAPEPLQVRLRGAGGETVVVRHAYRVRVPGAGVVQPMAGAQGVRFSAVAVAPDGTVWAGGDGGATLVQVRPGALGASLVGQLLEDPRGRVEDLVVDALGRLHALVFAPTGSGDIVVDQGIFCQTVNVLDAAYPFQSPNPETGIPLPSASTRGLAAGGGDLWLFGSDGGVARVTDAFRGGQCLEPGPGVSYGPIFRREESGLLSNSVTSMVASTDTTLWFGTIFGLTRFQGGRFAPQPFLPNSPVGGDITSLEKSIREALQQASSSSSEPSVKRAISLEQFLKALAQALFKAQPLSTFGFGGVSFVELFGGPLIKGDLIYSLAEDWQGRLWVGTLGAGLRRVEMSGGLARDTLHLTRQEGLGSNILLALTVGPEGSVWAATDEGVSRLREEGGETPSITTFSALDGTPTPVQDVAVAGDGTVWLATDRGLYRLLARGGVVRGMVVDSRGQPVAGAEVVGVGTPFRAVTDPAGQFALVDVTPGPIRLEVVSSFVSGGPFDSVVHDRTVLVGEQTLPPLVLPEPGPLVRVSGEGQVGVVGRPLPQPLVVAVREGYGRPIAGLPVMFRALDGQGTLTPVQVPTGADGQAATILILGPVAGGNVVQARVEGLGAVEFTARGIASGVADRNTASLIIVSGNHQVGRPGQVLPEPLVVRLADQFGNPLVGEPITGAIIAGDGVLLPAPPEPAGDGVLLPAPPEPASVRVSPTQQIDANPQVTMLTDAQGRAAFLLELGASGESIVVKVTAAELPQMPSVNFLTVIGLISPKGIAVEVSNSLVVVDSDLRAVVRVDSMDGSAAIIADSNVGGGPPFIEPLAIAAEATGALVVIDAELRAVMRVNPQTGDRKLVSGCPAIDTEGSCVGGIIGGGPSFNRPAALAVEATGALVVVDSDLGAVLRVDPQTGDRAIISGCAALDAEGRCVGGITGPGPSFVFPKAIAVEAAGALVIVDAGLGAVLRVDPQTGDRALVSGCPAIDAQRNCRGTLIGQGPAFVLPWAIAVEATGALLVVDAGLGAVMRVSPQTGDRALVSGCPAIDTEGRCVGGIIGDGPPFVFPEALTVETAKSLAVVDAGLGAVMRVDPHTGDRAIVRLGTGRGRGPRLDLPAALVVEAAGSLVVIDAGLDAVVRVDPQTGDRTIVSGCAAIDVEARCVREIIGRGPLFDLPVALAVEATGTLVVVDAGLGAVIRVDPHTGDRAIVSDARIGRGPLFDLPAAIAVEAAGALVIVDARLGAVVRVEPHTGDRALVSGCPAINAQPNCRGTLIGQGPPFRIPSAIAIAADGHLWVGDTLRQAVMRVDPSTGDRAIVSGCAAIDTERRCVGGLIGGGPPFDFPEALAVEAAGALVVVDARLGAVVRIDPGTGDRAMVSDARIGRGLPLFFPVAIAVEATRSLVVIDRKINAVVRVDPHTGDRAIVSTGAE